MENAHTPLNMSSQLFLIAQEPLKWNSILLMAKMYFPKEVIKAAQNSSDLTLLSYFKQ